MRGIRRLTVRVSFCVRTAMTRFDDKLAATIAHARRHTLGDLVRRTASRAPDRIALIYRDLRQSYAELDATINRTANALAQRGVVKGRSEEHTSELQSRRDLVCRLLLEKK